MKLTKRAADFLSKQEYRDDAVKSLDVIENAFSKIGLTPTQELIDFQMKYGGLTFYSGLEPICFGILHGEKVRGDYFGSPKKRINELIVFPSDEDEPQNHLICADTRYAEYFTIDFKGNYFEHLEIEATSFDIIIEDYAIFREIAKLGYKKSISENFEDFELDFEKIKSDLSFINYPEFPQDIIKWAKNDEFAIRITDCDIRLFSKNEVTDEQKGYLKEIINEGSL